MLIRCPKCSTGFNLPEDKIPEKGAKVRCSACTHTFRVRLEDGEPVFFYKKGEKGKKLSTSGTAIGSPRMLESAGVGDEESERTQFGLGQREEPKSKRSKSSKAGYNPFPLAGKLGGDASTVAADANEQTHLLGGSVTTPVEDIPLGDLLGPNDRTHLGASGLAEESAGDRTQLGAPLTSAEDDAAAPAGVISDDHGDRTNAFGSGALDLFEGAVPAPEPAQSASVDFDPFGDAFDEPVSGDVGLLMPSTPSLIDEPSHPETSSPPLLPDPPEAKMDGMSEEAFLGGGGGSAFGDAFSLVDESYGMDMDSFAPEEDDAPPLVAPTKKGRRTNTRPPTIEIDEDLVLDDVRPEPEPTKRAEPKRGRRGPAMRPEPVSKPEPKPAPKKKVVPVYAQNATIGATSPVRRTFDVIFIALVVATAFIALVTARAGGFVDFTRFGHMVEVAFADEAFVPRDEWKEVVQLEPVEPPPEKPLRVENLRALERAVGDTHVLMVSGKIRNYSRKEYKGVKVRVTVNEGDKKVSEKLHTVGQALDRKKIEKAETLADLQASVVKKAADIGKEGTTHFAIVFDDVPSKLVKSGKYDYSVSVAY